LTGNFKVLDIAVDVFGRVTFDGARLHPVYWLLSGPSDGVVLPLVIWTMLYLVFL
jgi:hypothetical protein